MVLAVAAVLLKQPQAVSVALVSAGGSGLVITCAALGLLYSVMRFEHDSPSRAGAGFQPASSSENSATRAGWKPAPQQLPYS